MRKRTVTSTESGDDKRPRHRNGDNGNNGNNGSGVPVSQVQTQPLQASLPSDGPRPQQVQVPQPHNVNSQCHVPAQPNAHPHPVSHVAHPPAHLPAPFSASGLPSTYSIHPGMYYTLPGRAPSSSNASHGAEAWSPAPGGPSLEAWQKNPYAQPLIDNGGDDDDEDDDSESSDCGDSASDDADDNVDTAGRTKSANGTGRSRGTRDGAQRERSTRRSPKASTSPGRGGGGASAANSEQDGEASGNQTHTAGRRSNRRQNRMASSTAAHAGLAAQMSIHSQHAMWKLNSDHNNFQSFHESLEPTPFLLPIFCILVVLVALGATLLTRMLMELKYSPDRGEHKQLLDSIPAVVKFCFNLFVDLDQVASSAQM